MITKLYGIIAESPAHPCLASAIAFLMHASVFRVGLDMSLLLIKVRRICLKDP
jgi:hypothetical protein